MKVLKKQNIHIMNIIWNRNSDGHWFKLNKILIFECPMPKKFKNQHLAFRKNLHRLMLSKETPNFHFLKEFATKLWRGYLLEHLRSQNNSILQLFIACLLCTKPPGTVARIISCSSPPATWRTEETSVPIRYSVKELCLGSYCNLGKKSWFDQSMS